MSRSTVWRQIGWMGLILGAALAVCMAAADQTRIQGSPKGASYTGVLPDGALWQARLPEHWNGTLLQIGRASCMGKM